MRIPPRYLTLLVLLGIGPATTGIAEPQGGDPAAQDGDTYDRSYNLARQLANPIADLISVPFQFNYDTPFGPEDADRVAVNIQPVIPFPVSPDWMVISRTILPVVYQEGPVAGVGDEFGLGDTLQSLFFSPKGSTPIWGVGPVMLLPTATDALLGGEKWGAGPTGVVLVQEGPWTYGMLANHIWSFAGDGDRDDINATFLQPFVAYTFPRATTVSLNTESSYDWTDSQWTVPLNLQVSQLMRLGSQPISVGVGGRWYAESSDNGPDWGLRTTLTFLFPR